MTTKKNRPVAESATGPVPDNGRAMAPVPTGITGYGRLIVAPETPADQWPTTLSDSPEHMCLRLNCLNTPDLELDENGQVDFWLQHVLAHPAESVDPDTGEVRQYSRLVMITPKGETFATTSLAVPHRVQQLLDLVNAGRMSLPVLVRVRARRSKKSGRIYHEMLVIQVEGQ